MTHEEKCEAWAIVKRRVKLRRVVGGWDFFPGCFGRFLVEAEAIWLVHMDDRYGNDE